ncbi:PIG-L family deacetylase, partial [Acinetobacter baumannii]
MSAWRGKEAKFLGYPDGRLGVAEESIAKVAEMLKTVKPDVILAFDPEFPPKFYHRDHLNSGRIAL